MGESHAAKFSRHIMAVNWRFMLTLTLFTITTALYGSQYRIKLQRAMAQIFIDAEISYSQNAIKSAVDTMKLSLPVMGNTARNLIGFSNGVFDTRTGNFRT